MKRILVIGGGSIGKRHLRNLLALGEKKISVIETNNERAKEIGKEFLVEVFTSLDQAAELDFEVVFICSPSVYHREHAWLFANKGCHLFIEKPVANNLAGIEDLLEKIKEKKLITMVGSNWKFYPLFEKMKELLDAGTIGRVLSARCQFGQYLPDWHPWEDYRRGYSANKKLGGGILLDSHEFDYLTWFLGKVKKLSCFAGKISDLEIDVEDVAEVILQFESETIGEIHLDYVQRFAQRNFEFFGEEGTISWDVLDKKVVLRTKQNDLQEFVLPSAYDLNDMYVEEVKHFLSCIDKNKNTMTSIKDGVDVLSLICAAKIASENNKVIVL